MWVRTRKCFCCDLYTKGGDCMLKEAREIKNLTYERTYCYDSLGNVRELPKEPIRDAKELPPYEAGTYYIVDNNVRRQIQYDPYYQKYRGYLLEAHYIGEGQRHEPLYRFKDGAGAHVELLGIKPER